MGKLYLYAPEVAEKISTLNSSLGELDEAIYPITRKFGFQNDPDQLEINMLNALEKALLFAGEAVAVMKLLRQHKTVESVDEPVESLAGLSATTADLRPEAQAAATAEPAAAATPAPVTEPVTAADTTNPAGDNPAMGTTTPAVVSTTPTGIVEPKRGKSMGLDELIDEAVNLGGNLFEGFEQFLNGLTGEAQTSNPTEDPTAPTKDTVADATPTNGTERSKLVIEPTEPQERTQLVIEPTEPQERPKLVIKPREEVTNTTDSNGTTDATALETREVVQVPTETPTEPAPTPPAQVTTSDAPTLARRPTTPLNQS